MLVHEIQDTAWKENYVFEDSSAESGVECTNRRSEILDTWMIDSKGQLMQASFNFNRTLNNTAYTPANWTFGIVYDRDILTPTSISAIKYSGDSSAWNSSSTFVNFFTSGGRVAGINVHTEDRTNPPSLTSDFWIVSNGTIVNGSKIASVSLATNQNDLNTQNGGRENKIFLQFEHLELYPRSILKQISMMSRNFYANANELFTTDRADISDIRE